MNHKEKRLGLIRLFLIMFPYFLIVGLFQFIGASFFEVDFVEQGSLVQIEQQVIVSLFGLLGTLLLIFLFVRFVDKIPFVNLGFHYLGRTKEIIIGLVLGFLIMLSAFLVLVFLNQIQLINYYFDSKKLFLTILIFLGVAFAEEILFRGYILRNLLNSFDKNIALLLSAIIFMSMHCANPNLSAVGLLNLFLAGVLLGIPYVATKNLWFPISLHFSWNFFQSLFGFNVSGQDSYSLIEFDILEKSLLNGGDFGFEGSILSLGIQLFLILLFFYYFTQKEVSLIGDNKKS